MTSIFVAKLDFGVSKEQLVELFAQYGEVSKAHLPTDKDTGKPRGFAFIEMSNDDEASEAIQALDGFEINRRRIAVKVAENRNDRSRPGGNTNRDSRPSNVGAPPRKSFGSDAAQPSMPPEENKSESRKKSFKGKSTKGFDSDQGGGGGKKAKKMTAHKKSGKNFNYFEDDEPIEGGLFSFDSDED
jgi:RNA recognition motif-containing protein